MTPSLTYSVKYKDKCFTFVHHHRHNNYGDALFKIAFNIKNIVDNGESRFLRLFDKLKIIDPDIGNNEAYKILDSLQLDDYSYMMLYEYDLLTLIRNGYVFSLPEDDDFQKGDVHIQVDFNRREIREIVSWLLVARKIYSFDNINEAIKDGKQIY
jgi:hypothetical protein